MTFDDGYVPPGEDDAPFDGTNVRPFKRPAHNAGPRVPPHDLAAEASLLGAMLLTPTAIDAAANLTAADFYKPAHGHIHNACVTLRAKGEPADPVTVADELHRDGLLERVGGPELLVELQAGCPATSNAGRYATIVDDHARLRRLIAVAAEIADLGYSLPADVSVVEARALALIPAPTVNSQEPLVSDLQAIMDGDVEPVIPDVAPRDDHATCLLYAPGINWLSGEPGEGKSFLALWWVAQVILGGGDALYLDYEGTEPGTVDRLRQMGVSDVTRLSYVRVVDKWDARRLAQLRELITAKAFRLAVIDAVAGAMDNEGLDPESNPDVEKWVGLIPNLLFASGAAVVCVDHVKKDRESRGRWPIGAQRKLARADAAFALDMRKPAGVGQTGYGRLTVAKDRYGALSQYQRGSTIAEVAIASEQGPDGYDLRIALSPPPCDAGPAEGEWKPTYYMEQVSRRLELHGPTGITELRTIASGKKGARKYVDDAVDALVKMGAIRPQEGVKGNAKPYESVFQYRQPSDIVPAYEERYEAPGPDDEPMF